MKPISLKSLERSGKRLLSRLLQWIFPRKAVPADFTPRRRILVFRLDNRIGNGVMLLPLLQGIRYTAPHLQVDILISPAVAELFSTYGSHLMHQIIPYNQAALFRNPLRWIGFIRRLRRAGYQLVISSSNPDAFSLSQAIFARIVSRGFTLGFRWKESDRFYDITVPSSTHKHYADAQVDLWRHFYPQTPFTLGGLQVPPERIQQLRNTLDEAFLGEVLLWIGATGNKWLPESAISFLYEALLKAGFRSVVLAAGPADREHLQRYSSRIQEKTVIWERPLVDTAAYFAGFRLFISGDTGPMHLAVVVGIPTITVFTTTNREQYGYHDGQRHRALQWDDSPAARMQLETAIETLSRNHASITE